VVVGLELGRRDIANGRQEPVVEPVDPLQATVYRSVQGFTLLFAEAGWPALPPWHRGPLAVDETYVKVAAADAMSTARSISLGGSSTCSSAKAGRYRCTEVP
jgi:hypothetical protein